MDVGVPELIIILVIVVLLWGPGRLAKIGGELGHGIHAFREGLSSKEEEQEELSQKQEQAVAPVANAAEQPVIMDNNKEIK